MCGILLHKGNHKITSRFHDNLEKLSHRGPDCKHFIHFNDIYIGHTRLSIIDLSEMGNQPMVSNCGNYILSFNGEIYNYKKLKIELENLGYSFNSMSDSEVLLNGFIHYRQKILEKLDGIFSFVIINKVDNSIFFARDNFGVKPLYYFAMGSNLILSSEARVFDSICDKDDLSKILFLSHGYIPSPKTIYKNVFSLLPGHYGIFKNERLKLIEYYNLSNLFKNDKKDFNSKLISAAVKSQLTSDAKIGCFFSGGVDSSILTYESSKHDNKIETYSVNFLNNKDEKIFQKALIDLYKINNKELKLSYKDFEINMDPFLTSMDQPSIDGFNTFFISNFVKKNNSKVSLSGLGADEIFYGYPIHKNYNNLYKLKKFKNLIPHRLLPNKYKKLEYLNLNTDYGIYLSQRGLFSVKEISEILEIDKNLIIDYLNQNIDEVKFNNNSSILNKMAYYEITKYMEGQLLKDSDVFGMSNSIEIRVPFLNKNLVEEVLRVKHQYKIDKYYNKPLLVEKYKNLLPKKIYERQKQGFELPYESWLKKSGIIDKIINSNTKHKFLLHSHWSKIWAMNILKSKY